MKQFFSDTMQELSGRYDVLVSSMPRILFVLAVLTVTWFLARLIRRLSDNRLKKKMEDPLLAEFLATMIRTVIIITGLLIALKIAGLGGVMTSILAGAGITAFIIGFALRDIGENFLAGIIMAFKRPFKVGDFVETGITKGTVVALNVRDTQLKTQDGKDVFVPNANIIKNPLINYTIDGYLRYDFIVGLPAGSDYNKSMQIIEETVNSVDGIIKKRRKPNVHITGIAPGRLDATVSFWIDTFKVRGLQEKIRSEVILKVNQALEQQAKSS